MPFGDQIVSYLPELRRFALKLCRSPHDAEELVQDCVERALQKSDRFEAGTNLRAWLFTLLRNQFMNSARRRNIERRYTQRLAEDCGKIGPPSQLTTVYFKQTMEILSELDPTDRVVLEEFCVKEAGLDDIANQLALPMGTIKSRIFRARQKLRVRAGLDDLKDAA